MRQHTVHRLPTGALMSPFARRLAERPPDRQAQNAPRENVVHRLPTGAFSLHPELAEGAIIGARKPASEPVPGFERHLVWQETPYERRFRIPLTSTPAQAPQPRPPARDPRPEVP